MSSAVTNNLSPRSSPGLSKEKIQQIIAAVGSKKADTGDQMETTEYNWRQPHYFSSEQRSKLDNFAKESASRISKKFASLYNTDFDVTIASVTEHFADEFLNQSSPHDQNSYYLAFSTDKEEPCGLVCIPQQAALAWTTQLLGDAQSEENSDRDLSQLEESLLLDIASALVEALSGSCETCDFHPAGNVTKKQLPLETAGSEELCKITFNVKKPDSESGSEAYFLILCDKLKPVVGGNAQADNIFSAQDISKATLGHIQQLPVSVTAQLASIVCTFEEIMNLGVDDILLLDKKVDEPVELIVADKTLFRGRPAKSAGKYAVIITELCDT